MPFPFSSDPSRTHRHPAPARVDVVIVSWNHEASTPKCLAALAAATHDKYVFDRVVLVDNASDARCQPGHLEGLPPITLLTNPHNAGFAAACNQGARGSRADYLLFLNPDATVSPAAVDVVVSALESDTDNRMAIAGAQLVDERGAPEATCGRFPTLTNLFCQMTGLSGFFPRRFPGMRMLEWDHRDTRHVDFVSAACLLIRRDVFERLGGFDEQLFLYLEDADLALRAHALGYRAIFSAAASVVHPSGWATRRHRAWRLAHSWRSLVVYAWKHFGTCRAMALTSFVVLLAPSARMAQAVLHRSRRDAAAALGAYVVFWLLLAKHAFGRRTARDEASDGTMRTITPARCPGAGRSSPPSVSSTPVDEIG